MSSLEEFNKACALFISYKNSHSEEDFAKLMTKRMNAVTKQIQRRNDKDCAKDSHGFNTVTTIGGGYIHTRCTNCGKSWSTPDVPFM